MNKAIRNLMIEIIVLKEALIALLAILEEKGILTSSEQTEVLNAIAIQLKAKE